MFKTNNQLNRIAQQEQGLQDKITVLQRLLDGLSADITRMVEQSGGTEEEKFELWKELKAKAQGEFVAVSEELEKNKRLLERVQRGDA